MSLLTTEQVIALAPDTASVKAARGLARPGKWSGPGRNNQVLWGQCEGGSLYEVAVDTSGSPYKCDCPSYKRPCKHVLGLLLMAAGQPDNVPKSEPPDWICAWLARRDQTARRKAARDESNADPKKLAKREADKQKRIAERQRKVDLGVEELKRWLRDLVRQGLIHARQQPMHYWDNMAERLWDAQARGLANWLRDAASIPASGTDWDERLLEQLGSLYLLLEAYQRRDSLPEPLQNDIRSRIGWTWKDDDLAKQAWVSDCWLMVGQRSYNEEEMRVRRSWLWGQQCERFALVLDFSRMDRPMPHMPPLGTWQEADLGFFPSQYPQRALLRNAKMTTEHGKPPTALSDSEALLNACTEALVQQPWLGVMAASITDIVPVNKDNQWYLRDRSAHLLPCHPQFGDPWRLLACSGGLPLTLFGEWDSQYFWPLSAWSEDRFTAFREDSDHGMV